MNEQQERAFVPTEDVGQGTVCAEPERLVLPGPEQPVNEPTPQAPEVAPVEAGPVDAPGANGTDTRHWHAEAGRKGARRAQELIQEGKLYEQEHGLKSGRQRLRQLMELGRLYEQEHGLGPATPKKARKRLGRGEREELFATLLQCLLRLAKPSFRAELQRLVEALEVEEKGQAA